MANKGPPKSAGGWTWYDSNFIGPGNRDRGNIPFARDHSDLVALQHDRGYSHIGPSAYTKFVKADQDFVDDVDAHPRKHSFGGLLGGGYFRLKSIFAPRHKLYDKHFNMVKYRSERLQQVINAREQGRAFPRPTDPPHALLKRKANYQRGRSAKRIQVPSIPYSLQAPRDVVMQDPYVSSGPTSYVVAKRAYEAYQRGWSMNQARRRLNLYNPGQFTGVRDYSYPHPAAVRYQRRKNRMAPRITFGGGGYKRGRRTGTAKTYMAGGCNPGRAAGRVLTAGTGGFTGVEKKFVDFEVVTSARPITATAITSQSPLTALCLNALVQGPGVSQRIGRKVKFEYLSINGTLSYIDSITAAQDAVTCAIWVVLDKQTNKGVPAVADIFALGTGSLSPHFLKNLEFDDRFVIIKKWTFVLKSSGLSNIPSTDVQQSNGDARVFSLNKRLNVTTEYVAETSPAVIGDISDNSFHIFVTCDSQDSRIKMEYVSRMRFIG